MDPITVVLQLLFGWAVKQWPALKAWPNRLIPAFNFVLALLVQLAGVSVAHAGGFGPLAHHPFWANLWALLGPAALNTLVATGIFSTGKNLNQYVAVQGS